MAGADYHNCDKCSKRVFYDADIYDRLEIGGDNGDVGALLVLCQTCAKTHRLAIVKKKTGKERGGKRK